MPDTPTPELIDSLRRSVRLWKTLALSFLAGLGLVIVLGMTMAAVQVERARREEQVARQAEMDARMQAERARQQAEDALRQAR
jgi:hypothetical protein